MHRNLFAFAALLATLGASLQAHAATLCAAGAPNTTSLAESTPSSAFTDSGNGTVTHNLTGLMWARCAEGQTWNGTTCINSATTFTWANALIQAKNASIDGHADWRLPNKKELESIVEFCGYSPSINTAEFPASPAWAFWSGSPYAPLSSDAWVVHFNDGESYHNYVGDDLNVRLVRGGQSFASFDAQKASQAISFGAGPTVVVGGTGAVSATGGASGNPVTFSSTTPSVCTVNSNTGTVTGVTAGTCIIAADQAGDGSYSAAPQVTQSFTVGALFGTATTAIPTLSEWGVMLLAGLLGLVGVGVMRRR